MPLYEYGCRACGTAFELRLKYDERLAPQQCPACGERQSSLKLSVPGPVGAGAAAGSAAAPAPGYCPGTGNACGCGLN
jgi:putative FmdB family regulatory protein